MIFYDSDWNPTVDQQAMDRAHRLGQTKQVMVYRLICQGSIEERMMQRAREKSEIQRMVIAGGSLRPDTLKPTEVVSLLLDDEELERKFKQRQLERKVSLDEPVPGTSGFGTPRSRKRRNDDQPKVYRIDNRDELINRDPQRKSTKKKAKEEPQDEDDMLDQELDSIGGDADSFPTSPYSEVSSTSNCLSLNKINV